MIPLSLCKLPSTLSTQKHLLSFLKILNSFLNQINNNSFIIRTIPNLQISLSFSQKIENLFLINLIIRNSHFGLSLSLGLNFLKNVSYQHLNQTLCFLSIKNLSIWNIIKLSVLFIFRLILHYSQFTHRNIPWNLLIFRLWFILSLLNLNNVSLHCKCFTWVSLSIHKKRVVFTLENKVQIFLQSAIINLLVIWVIVKHLIKAVLFIVLSILNCIIIKLNNCVLGSRFEALNLKFDFILSFFLNLFL